MSITAPLFKRKESLYFIRVGLCSHTVLPVQDAMAAYRMSDVIKTATIAWTRVHAIIRSTTCAKRRLKWRGSDDLPRATWQPEDLRIGIKSKGDRSPSDGRCKLIKIDRNRTAYLIDIGRLTWFASDGAEMLWKNFAIEPQSRRDRAAIACLLPQNRLYPSRRWSTELQDHDRHTIVAWSWCDRGKKLEAFWPWNPVKIGAELEPRPMPKESPPRRLKTAPTNASIAHDHRANSLFKTNVFLPFKLNFWSIREGIKRISRKIFSSSWSPCV